MYGHINEIIDSLPDDMRETAATPARSHVFKMDETTTTNKLDAETTDLFHHYTIRLLFLSKHTQFDIQTAVVFLCTRVREPDTDN